LSHGVQVTGVTWRAVTMIVVGVGDLVQRIRDGQAQVGYSVARQSGGSGDALCGQYRANGDDERGFFG
jgi:hypothetical protein